MQIEPTLPASVNQAGISLPRISMLIEQNQLPLAVERASPPRVKAPSERPSLIMVGLDDKGRPHASWFGARQVAAATVAADLMDMALIAVTSEELAALAGRLPEGKLFESGKAFVPFVKREIYDHLATYLDEGYLATSAARIEAAKSEAASADYANASKGETAVRQPEDWSKLTVGDRVLASDGPGDGWYEADVVEALPDDQFRLRWRDWPEIDVFTRSITDIALLHPKHVDG